MGAYKVRTLAYVAASTIRADQQRCCDGCSACHSSGLVQGRCRHRVANVYGEVAVWLTAA